jgi:hypothetical protein
MIEHCKNMDYSGFLPQRSTSGTSWGVCFFTMRFYDPTLS